MSTPKFFNARNWAGLLNKEQMAFLSDVAIKLQEVEDGATSDQTSSEIETLYNTAVSVVSQADAEAGTSTTVYRWTPERVAQAIAALGGSGGGLTHPQILARGLGA